MASAGGRQRGLSVDPSEGAASGSRPQSAAQRMRRKRRSLGGLTVEAHRAARAAELHSTDTDGRNALHQRSPVSAPNRKIQRRPSLSSPLSASRAAQESVTPLSGSTPSLFATSTPEASSCGAPGTVPWHEGFFDGLRGKGSGNRNGFHNNIGPGASTSTSTSIGTEEFDESAHHHTVVIGRRNRALSESGRGLVSRGSRANTTSGGNSEDLIPEPTNESVRRKSLGHSARLHIEKSRRQLEGFRTVQLVVSLSTLFILGLVLFWLWMRPELIGYQYHKVILSKPSCFEIQRGFKTGGNANRMEALFYALHLAYEREFRYIAVPDDWQQWMCKIFNEKSINDFPVPIVPTDTGKGCPNVFYPIFLKQIRKKEIDVCEEWHLANFYRVPWYLHSKFNFENWKYFLPTGGNYREIANKRMQDVRLAHPNKKLVTVHKRWLSVWCSKNIDPSRIPRNDVRERFCHLTPDVVLDQVAKAGLNVDEIHILVSSDHYMKEEDSRMAIWEMETEEVPFMSQVLTWTHSDLHIGHPNSTIDHMACRWRALSDKNRLCMPFELMQVALVGYNGEKAVFE